MRYCKVFKQNSILKILIRNLTILSMTQNPQTLCISCFSHSVLKKRQRNGSPSVEQNVIIPGHVVTSQAAFLLCPYFLSQNKNTTSQVNLSVAQTSCSHSLELKDKLTSRLAKPEYPHITICFRVPFANTF